MKSEYKTQGKATKLDGGVRGAIFKQFEHGIVICMSFARQRLLFIKEKKRLERTPLSMGDAGTI